MTSTECVRFAAALCVVVTPALSSAQTWVCHTDDGRTWQQENPPCVLPADPSRLSPRPQRETPPPTTKRTSKVAPPQQTSVAQAPTERVLYDRAVAELEQQFPALNPDAQAFDRELVKRVLTRKDFYVQKAYGQDHAIRAAVADVMNPPSSARALENPTNDLATSSSPGKSSIVEEGIKGAAKGLVYGVLGAIAMLVWWLIRRSRKIIVRAAYAVGNTSVNDLARAAGGASAKAQEKTAGVLDAFKEGRKAAARRRDER